MLSSLLSIALMTGRSAPASDLVAPGAKLQKLGDGFSFTEGPVPDKKGDVFFTDQPNDRILEWKTDGAIVEWMKPCGRANGMALDKKGNLIACADEKNQLWSISPSQQTTVLVANYNGKLLNGPNDVWIRPDGAMYVTDPLYPRPYWSREPTSQLPGNYVFYLSKDRTTFRPVASDLGVPNGIVGTPDGKSLYIGDLGRNATWEFTIQKNGDLTDKRKFCDLGSDGMTIDDEGNVYLSGKGVTVFNKSGQQVLHVDVPEDWVGHVCFGGPGHRMLFITASHGIYGLKMRVHGV